MDILTKEQRHLNMSHIKSKNTKIEQLLRKALWRQGYRYRKNYKLLPGKPDIVLTKYKIAIFCDSEFWHGYNWDEKQKKITVHKDYWIEKISKNIVHDQDVNKTLEAMGWTVLRFWGKDIIKHTDSCVQIVKDTILAVIINSWRY